MKPSYRQEKIMEMLSTNLEVNVLELSQLFKVTDETIRRDLNNLEKENKVIRTHGGAKLISNRKNEVPIEIRKDIFKENKDTMAKICVNYINNGDVIFLDASTTVYHILDFLPPEANVTIVSNSLAILSHASKLKIKKLIMLGGEYDALTNSFIGVETIEQADKIYFDKAFISCRGINFDSITDANIEQANLRSKVFNHASRLFLVADHTKFNITSMYKIKDLKCINHIITDKTPILKWKNHLNNLNIKVEY
ncbi:DeoR/GlpR family DNA-binding transcription regulator [Helcococcus sueciensis]|uniref:DeoR/GlpR family DNA-binding transcription regulator n=1 Tax=Helcococcus sueciensis TaxID=241555 RepID=UPI0004145B41|nr:DeoR/GlpR family DNA-binding transcription regulator [Helcococcus sueciensis]